MKRVLTSSVVVLMVLFLSAGLGLAGGKGQGGGKGGGGSIGGGGNGGGTGPIHDIFAGTPFTYVGDVISYVQGQGMEIATVDENGDGINVTIYGIGPVRYWDSDDVDVSQPGVGETITVTGYTVDYNGVERNIAVTITVGGVEVQLRDPVTGVPLWRR